MAFRNLICAGACSAVLAGCSIHPLPDDVTRDTTLEIANKIRCEARDALILQFLDLLMEINTPQNMALLAKLDDLGTDAQVMRSLQDSEIDDRTLMRVDRFKESTVSYLFNLTMTENNEKSGSANFRMPMFNGLFTLGLSGGSNKTRKNFRTFEVTDTFSSLVTGLNTKGEETGLFCEDYNKPRRHWIYPITGKIGMEELIDTYIEMEKTSGTVSAFSDTLTFTTVFNASANPSVSINPNPTPNLFRLSSASLTASASRTDEHEVKIAFVKPPAPVAKKAEEYVQLFQPTKVEGLPAGTEVGLTVKVPKRMVSKGKKTKRLGPDYLPDQTRRERPAPRKPMGSMFRISPETEAYGLREGARELRRLDSLDRARDLNELIGR